MKKLVTLTGIILVLVGCTARVVDGDLMNVSTGKTVPSCDSGKFEYQFTYSTDAENEYSDGSQAMNISLFTFGLVPTKSRQAVSSEILVWQGPKLTDKFNYSSTIEKYYGLFWITFLSSENINTVKADSGSGIRIEEAVYSRTMAKALSDFRLVNKSDSICVVRRS